MNGSPFTSAAQYISYVEYYAPTVRAAGVPIIYNPGAYAQANALAWYPGDQWTDGVSVDYYADDYLGPAAIRLDAIEALADNHSGGPVPFGVAEWGMGHELYTQAQFETFTSYLGEFFYARLAAGKANGPIVYYDINLTAGQQNLVTGPDDIKVPGIQSVYQAVSLQVLGS
jgi:hypothetical protein